MNRPVVYTALATAVCLVGGMIAGLALGTLVHGLPFHAPEQTMVLLSSIPALAGVFGGGALWGYLTAQIHHFPNRGRFAVAGSIGYGLAFVSAVILLSLLERLFVEQSRFPGLPIHIIFTLLFVPAAFLVATVGAAAILLASPARARWSRSALVVGLVAALTFLVVDLALDAAGWRVGAPHAAERATMLTVSFVSSAVAALSAGALLGRILSKPPAQTPPAA